METLLRIQVTKVNNISNSPFLKIHIFQKACTTIKKISHEYIKKGNKTKKITKSVE